MTRSLILLLGSLIAGLIAGCANSGAQPIGKDTFLASVRVPFSGSTGAKTDALITANRHCEQLGKKVLLTRITSSECALRGGCGEAEITYMCLNEDDSRFKSPRLEKDADTVIRIQ